MIYANELEAKVVAVNTANAIALELGPEMRKMMAAFAGKKIYTQDGLAKTLRESAEPHTGAIRKKYPNCQIWFQKYSLTLYVQIKAWANYKIGHGEHCSTTYHETSFVICEVNGVDAVPVAADAYHLTPENYPTDWTVQKVTELRRQYEAAEEAARKARSALGPFAR
jgi:hypothetical protein